MRLMCDRAGGEELTTLLSARSQECSNRSKRFDRKAKHPMLLEKHVPVALHERLEGPALKRQLRIRPFRTAESLTGLFASIKLDALQYKTKPGISIVPVSIIGVLSPAGNSPPASPKFVQASGCPGLSEASRWSKAPGTTPASAMVQVVAEKNTMPRMDTALLIASPCPRLWQVCPQTQPRTSRVHFGKSRLGRVPCHKRGR